MNNELGTISLVKTGLAWAQRLRRLRGKGYMRKICIILREALEKFCKIYGFFPEIYE
jgi:hypothetical protein